MATARGRGTFAGTNALWRASRVLLVGVGQRTNVEGAAAVTAILRARSHDAARCLRTASMKRSSWRKRSGNLCRTMGSSARPATPR